MHHARKVSRKATLTDQFHYLLMLSDPFISSQRKCPQTKRCDLSEEALLLVKNDSHDRDIHLSSDEM